MPESSRPAPFGRLITAMATPFTTGGDLDLDGAVRLAEWLVEQGNHALVIAGSTGESAMLSDDERIELWRAIAAAVDVPVLAGSTTGDTRHSVELTKAAESTGVAGILATTPYYSRPPQSGLFAHFREVASATSLPVLLYDVPARTGRKLAESTVLELADKCENVVGLKDAGGDVIATSRLIAAAPDGFACYSGDDSLVLPMLSVGGCGLISVAAHWCTPELVELIDAYLAGDPERAVAIFQGLLPSFAFETGDSGPNPMPTKAVLRHLGLPAGQCRLPLGDAAPALDADAASVIGELSRWRESRR